MKTLPLCIHTDTLTDICLRIALISVGTVGSDFCCVRVSV